ncbi:YihY family inner membrane protein [Piscinibacter sp.]|uniref:YihY family inner membrane protein n=1 Tax=Piscinibacter sp. TaxID=1903157 RepID=UPI002CB27CFF|nr:YihY family inner membrane protein [Albitalea sp.]HUG21167.1 YihY family inner membrane protein [Albitalea sp.]
MNFPTTLRATWQGHVTRLVQTLQTWPWLETLQTLRQRFREDRLGITASSLTFTTLISLVPLVTVMLAVFSAFPMFASVQGSVEKYFLRALVPDSIAKPVLSALTQFASKANSLGSVGLIILIFTALALMLTIDRTLNAIWRVRTPRPIAQRVLVYWAAVTLGPLLVGGSITLTSYALSASKGLVGGMPGGVKLLLDALVFGLQAAGVAALFHYVPNTTVRWRHAIAGGVFVAIGLEVAQWGLAWYLSRIPSFSLVYGTFATLPILLVWIYLGWVIVLLGAVIAAYAPSLQMRVVRLPDLPGSRFHLAVTLLRTLARARLTTRHGMSLPELAEALRTDPLQIEPILDTLVAIDWAGRLDEGGTARYVLLCDPGTTPAAPVLSQLLLEPSPTLRRFWQRAGFSDMTLRELIDD